MEQQTLIASLEQATLPPLPARRDWRIGCVGAGFIMRDCQLAAYRDLGFQAHAITSLSQQESEAVAAQYAIPHVYGHWRDLLAVPEVHGYVVERRDPREVLHDAFGC